MPGYASKIERLRLDMHHIVRYNNWQAGLDFKFTALSGLRQIQLCTHTDQGPDALTARWERLQRSTLTQAVMDLLPVRHCLTVVVIRNGSFYCRLDRESKIEGQLIESV